MSTNNVIVEMRNIVKVYSDGTVALRGVNFTVLNGEIHGILGENGAGKTTLMNILFGKLSPTHGEIYIRGKLVRFNSPNDAIKEGIGMVHQHFMLIPVFTALDNIILGYEYTKNRIIIDKDKARKEINELMQNVGLKVDLDAPVEYLPVGMQQRIEILKIIYRKASIIILDEPTSVLTPIETRELFNFLRQLKNAGKTIIFISHKLKEVLEITDRITVLRKGLVIGTVKTKDTTLEELAKMMIGHELSSLSFIKSKFLPKSNNGEEVLKVENLWVKDDRGKIAVKGLTFTVHSNEIFGIAGVEGNGQSELIQAITGLRKPLKGKIYIKGKALINPTPSDLYDNGVAHIPEDRHRHGLILDFTVAENSILGLQNHAPFSSKLGLLQKQVIDDWALKLIKKFNIDTPGLYVKTRSLSGGNQQKLVVGREIMKDPRLIIASQPTRGLDIASTQYIRNLLLEMKNMGKAILLVSADLDEIIELSDRMAVMYEGEFVNIVDPKKVTEEQIGLMMGGVKDDQRK